MIHGATRLADVATAKVAESDAGMAVTSSPYATAAATRILREGGNAVDGAVAACLALTVADVANTSLFGRCHILLCLRDGTVAAIDGATKAPDRVPPLAEGAPPRTGHGVAPLSGNIAALGKALAGHGRLAWADVAAPAIELAEGGFEIPENLGAIWSGLGPILAQDEGTKRHFLRADGSPYRAGDLFRQPALCRFLQRIADEGPTIPYVGELAEGIAAESAAKGGFLTASDLAGYRACDGEVIATRYRDHEAITIGRQAWGHTLVQMLNTLERLKLGRGASTPRESAEMALVVFCALADRPQQIGSLIPKAGGYDLETLTEPDFAARRAVDIRALLDGDPDSLAAYLSSAIDWKGEGGGHTTNLSVIDAEGNAVALTTSIGHHFGARVASEEHGFLFAHSYRMASDPTPKARDLTEMTPTLIRRDGKTVMAVGAAGSERIPGAVLQILSNVIDRGFSLGEAVSHPRLNWAGGRLLTHQGFAASLREALERYGFPVKTDDDSREDNLGVAHAAAWNPATGRLSGAADGAYDGAAAGPQSAVRED